MRDEYLMTGSVGLDNNAWQPAFYDEDLPADWRAAYYSTLLRSVYLPPQEWQQAIDEDWIDEVDDDFCFVLQLKSFEDYSLLCKQPSEFLDQIAGLVLLYDDTESSGYSSELITKIQSSYPVCLDAGAVDISANGIDRLCEELDVNCVWYPATQASPFSRGKFLVTVINTEALPEQREIVTKIKGWMRPGCRAGLYNNNPDNAPVRAQETRVLAELMGV